MKTPFIYRRPNEGAALIIVLTLLVLVSVAVLIELAISTSQRNSSDAVASGTSAELLARSAGAMVIGQLVQEIQDGSYPAAAGVNTIDTNGYTTYWPATNFTMRIAVSGVPASLLTAYPNLPLVKESKNGSNFYGTTGYYTNNTDPNNPITTNGVSWASSASTTNSSANGHSIGVARWNEPLFLPLKTTSSVTDFTPVTTFVAPDWIYMTRGGPQVLATSNLQPGPTSASNPISSNTNYVIGRFAFNVYDEGGLLDVAAAGYNSGSDLSSTGSLVRKGCIGTADLTQLTNAATAKLAASQANALVSWRNPNTATGTGSPGGYSYYLFNQAPITGFLQPATGDESFTSRQDLLAFWLSKIATLGTPGVGALRYFTTFSREVNAPAWAPLLNSSQLQEDPVSPSDRDPHGTNNYAYAGNANLTNAWNRNVLSVRVETSFTRRDGTTAQVGEPLIKTRFDLNRLSWITYNGVPPTGVTATDIYNYFGLTWYAPSAADSTSTLNGAWVYNHSTLTPPSASPPPQTSTIMSLDQVATLPSGSAREPDFFELLQAGILQGSLGLFSGDPTLPNGTAIGGELANQGGDASAPLFKWGELYRANYTTNSYGTQVPYGTNAVGEIISPASGYYNTGAWESYGVSPTSVTVNVDPQGYVVNSMEKYQIMQIGANIISQYSSDNYPTPIQFNNSGSSPTLGTVTSPQNSMTFYGIKNLPYFNSIGSRQFRPADSRQYPNAISPNTDEAYLHAWILFSLWNPDMNAANPPTASPANLRVIARYGQLTPYWYGYNGNSNSGAAAGNSNPDVTIQPRDFSSSPAWVEFPASYNGYFATPTEITTAAAQAAGVTTDNNTYDEIPTMFNNASAPDYNDVGLYVGYNESWDYSLPMNAYYGPAFTPTGINTNWVHSGFFLLPTLQTSQAAAQSWVNNGTSSFQPNKPFNLELQYQGSDNNWHTYQVVPGLLLTSPQQGSPYLEPGDPMWGINPLLNTNDTKSDVSWTFVDTIPQGMADPVLAYIDPRTTRIPPQHAGGLSSSAITSGYITGTTIPAEGTLFTANFAESPTLGWSPNANGGGNWYFATFVGPHAQTTSPSLAQTLWDDNFPITPPSAGFVFNATTYYTDRDYVRRLGDTGGYAFSNTYVGNDPFRAGSAGQPYRPIVLSEPFHSVGELGYTFRDDPWKSIDFSTDKSGDLALLDLFCIGPGASTTPEAATPSVVAGKVNINSAPSQVLTAILSGTGLTLSTSNPQTFSANLTTANVQTIVTTFTNYIAGNVTGTTPASGPLMTPADLPFVLPQVPVYAGASGGTPSVPAATSFPGMGVKTSRELTIRALSSSVSTRTWNVLIDVIAQSGRFSPAATTLDQFSDKGERRYWIHVAIDRYTGKIVDEKLEFVPQ